MYLISEESPLAWSHFGNISRVCQRPPTQGAGVDLNLTRPSSYCGHYVFAAVVAPSGCSSPTLDRLYTPTTWYGTKPSMYTINYDANPQYPLQQRSLKCKNLHSQVPTIIPASTNQCACRVRQANPFITESQQDPTDPTDGRRPSAMSIQCSCPPPSSAGPGTHIMRKWKVDRSESNVNNVIINGTREEKMQAAKNTRRDTGYQQ